MATVEPAQTEAIARGLRLDAAVGVQRKGEPLTYLAKASSQPERGKGATYIGQGLNEDEAYDDLIASMPPRADQNGPLCPLCNQPLPEGMSLGSQRYDAPE